MEWRLGKRHMVIVIMIRVRVPRHTEKYVSVGTSQIERKSNHTLVIRAANFHDRTPMRLMNWPKPSH